MEQTQTTYARKFRILDDVNHSLLRHKLAKFSEVKFDDLNIPITFGEMEYLPKKKKTDSKIFTTKLLRR